MKSKYFNNWEFKQALFSVGGNLLEAKLKYEDYLEKYPKDYSTYTYYAYVLITLGELDEAEKVLNYVKSISSKDNRFIDKSKKNKVYKNNLLFCNIRLLSFQEKYDELYQFLLNYSQEIKNSGLDISPLLFYCTKKTGRLELEEREPNFYLFKQIIEYRESDFLDHIKKHLADYNKNLDKPNKNIFVPSFPVNEIIEEIKKYIPSDKKLYYGLYEDTYIFKYNGCGRVDNKLVDYFKAVCFHNTQEFITIVPISDGQYLPHVDLNYMIKDDTELPKVKRMSQIEKFNQKYGHKSD